MEKGITRFVALLCAIGGLGLAWAFGAFAAIPVRDGRILSMSGVEMQILAVSFVACALVAWGAVHLLSLADRVDSPGAFRLMRAAYGVALLGAAAVGANWSLVHVVSQ